MLGVSFLKQLECWCNVVRYHPLNTVSVILNLEHLNRMNLKYKKMEQLVSCIVAKPLFVLNQTAHRVVATCFMLRPCVDFV